MYALRPTLGTGLGTIQHAARFGRAMLSFAWYHSACSFLGRARPGARASISHLRRLQRAFPRSVESPFRELRDRFKVLRNVEPAEVVEQE